MADALARRLIDLEPLAPDELDALLDAARELVAIGIAGQGPLAVLARHLPLALAHIDEQRMVVAATGFSAERLGLPVDAFLGPVDQWGPVAGDAADRALAGEATRFDIEGEINGVRFCYRVLLMPSAEGGADAIAVDLSEQLEARVALADRDELLHASVAALETAIVVQDDQGRVLSHNHALLELLGADLPGGTGDRAGEHAGDLVGESTAAILGQRPDELLRHVTHENGVPFDQEQFPGRVALRTGEAQRNVMMRVTRRDGSVRLLQVNSFPIQLSERSVVLSSLSDVTNRSATEAILRDSEDRFRLLADAAPIGVYVAAPDGTALYVNPQGEINAGRTAAEIRTMGWSELVHPDDVEQLGALQAEQLASGDSFVAEYRLPRPDGTAIWVRSRGRRIQGDDGEVVGYVGTIADITEVREAADRLRESEERTRAILESAAEGIVGCRADGVIVEFNAAAERIFGYDSSEVLGRISAIELLVEADRERLTLAWRAEVSGGLPRVIGTGSHEFTGQRKDGTAIAIELTVTQVETSEGRLYTGVIRDLSEQRALESELEHRATHDPLTGLPNRVLFNVQLDAARGRARKRSHAVCVLSILVDRVSLVSASLGHEAADELLATAAVRITKAIDPVAPPARIAPDQFVVLLDELDDINEAVELAGRIIEAIGEPFSLGEEEALATARIGIAMAPPEVAATADLLADAGVAMRRALEGGPFAYEIFDPGMRAQVDAQLRDEIALRHALERGELLLHYQPIVELDGGRVRGAEALLRWQRDDALVLPGTFIPVAEESGLIVDIGAWVVREACAQVATWQRQLGPACPVVSINLSGRQLAHPDLIDTVRRAIVGTGADPANLAFEITESVLLHDVDRAVATLEALRDLGVKLSLDDFGTGYSSLTYLCRFPVDALKIDRSFVSEDRNINEPIVAMILGLAGTLGLDVVAEGVETELQAETLRLAGCRAAQGFLFARPAPAAALAQRLAPPPDLGP